LTKRLSAYLEFAMYSAYRLAPFFTCRRPHAQRKPLRGSAARGWEEGAGYEDLGDVAHALDGGEL
jgi:hypothetical protein